MTSRRRALAALLSLCSLAACAGGPAEPRERRTEPFAAKGGADASYVFTRLDVPGSAQTMPSGINADGSIVGWYVTGGVTRGFLYEDGEFTTVVYPGAAFTQLRGIGPSGEAVGTYRMTGEPAVNFHGFIRTAAGELIAADYPGHTNTIAQRILPDGTILGCRHDNDTMGSMRGVKMDGTSTSEIDTFASMNNGGTPNGRRIAGFFTDMDLGNRGRAYLIEDGVFTPFDAPGSAYTDAWDMNPAGAIVGSFRDNAARTHGYVREDEDFTTIDFPAAAFTDVFGINARGDIVGKFRETPTGPFHGYVGTRVATR